MGFLNVYPGVHCSCFLVARPCVRKLSTVSLHGHSTQQFVFKGDQYIIHRAEDVNLTAFKIHLSHKPLLKMLQSTLDFLSGEVVS